MNDNFYRHLAEFIINSTPAWVVTVISVDGSSPASIGMKMLIPESGDEIHGTIGGGDIEHEIINTVLESRPILVQSIDFDLSGKSESDMICGGSATVMIEPLNQSPELFIFGGGHCGIALSSLASKCGFRVTVVDSREEWANSEKHPESVGCRIIDFCDAADLIKNPDRTYAVIMTYGHQFDEVVLEKLVNMPLKYLGMMGSKNKVKEVFSNLKGNGIDESLLDKVYAPIGLKIGSRTPWEIAVSIIAELIKIRNKYFF